MPFRMHFICGAGRLVIGLCLALAALPALAANTAGQTTGINGQAGAADSKVSEAASNTQLTQSTSTYGAAMAVGLSDVPLNAFGADRYVDNISANKALLTFKDTTELQAAANSGYFRFDFMRPALSKVVDFAGTDSSGTRGVSSASDVTGSQTTTKTVTDVARRLDTRSASAFSAANTVTDSKVINMSRQDCRSPYNPATGLINTSLPATVCNPRSWTETIQATLTYTPTVGGAARSRTQLQDDAKSLSKTVGGAWTTGFTRTAGSPPAVSYLGMQSCPPSYAHGATYPVKSSSGNVAWATAAQLSAMGTSGAWGSCPAGVQSAKRHWDVNTTYKCYDTKAYAWPLASPTQTDVNVTYSNVTCKPNTMTVTAEWWGSWRRASGSNTTTASSNINLVEGYYWGSPSRNYIGGDYNRTVIDLTLAKTAVPGTTVTVTAQYGTGASAFGNGMLTDSFTFSGGETWYNNASFYWAGRKGDQVSMTSTNIRLPSYDSSPNLTYVKVTYTAYK